MVYWQKSRAISDFTHLYHYIWHCFPDHSNLQSLIRHHVLSWHSFFTIASLLLWTVPDHGPGKESFTYLQEEHLWANHELQNESPAYSPGVHYRLNLSNFQKYWQAKWWTLESFLYKFIPSDKHHYSRSLAFACFHRRETGISLSKEQLL